MRIKYHYAYSIKENIITKELLNLNIPFKTGDILISFDIFDDNKNWLYIKNIMDKNGVIPVIEKEFIKKEVEEAEWLEIRSNWRWSYPQPEDEYESITYNNSNYCDKCGRGLAQIDSFYLKKEPKWGTKQFLQLFWIEDELFIKTDIIDIIDNNDIKGLSYLPVKHFKSKEELKTIKQIKIDIIMNEELNFKESEIKKTIICSKCNQAKHVLYGYAINKVNRKFISRYNTDIIKTKNVFGDGVMAARQIFISNKFAKLILAMKWKNVVLEPIQLI